MTRIRGDSGFKHIAHRLILVTASASVALLVCGSEVAAQTPKLDERERQAKAKLPDPANGIIIARKLCVTCHHLGEEPNAAMPADVPTFTSIANRAGQSAEGLSRWLIQPHAPMPDPHLTQKEVRDLSAYILSLRRAD